MLNIYIMKIDCQEHYDKAVEYAKSISDTTFQNCIDCLKQRETNSHEVYEIVSDLQNSLPMKGA